MKNSVLVTATAVVLATIAIADRGAHGQAVTATRCIDVTPAEKSLLQECRRMSFFIKYDDAPILDPSSDARCVGSLTTAFNTGVGAKYSSKADLALASRCEFAKACGLQIPGEDPGACAPPRCRDGSCGW